MAFFFDDLDGPLISMELGRPRVVLPGPDYPGDPAWWESGFDAYAKGWPPRNGGRPMDEADSWMHGYMTARMADLLGAVVPDSLPDVSGGESPMRSMIKQDPDRGADDREPVEHGGRDGELALDDLWSRDASMEDVADDLCPFSDRKELRLAWLEGFLRRGRGLTFFAEYGGLGSEGVDAYRDGVRTRSELEKEGGPLSGSAK